MGRSCVLLASRRPCVSRSSVACYWCRADGECRKASREYGLKEYARDSWKCSLRMALLISEEHNRGS